MKTTENDKVICSPLFVDNDGNGRGGLMTVDEMCQTIWQYYERQFDKLLIDSLKVGLSKGEIVEENDRFKLLFLVKG